MSKRTNFKRAKGQSLAQQISAAPTIEAKFVLAQFGRKTPPSPLAEVMISFRAGSGKCKEESKKFIVDLVKRGLDDGSFYQPDIRVEGIAEIISAPKMMSALSAAAFEADYFIERQKDLADPLRFRIIKAYVDGIRTYMTWEETAKYVGYKGDPSTGNFARLWKQTLNGLPPRFDSEKLRSQAKHAKM